MSEQTGGIAQAQLRAIVDRIDRLEEEKTALMADIREVYAEAKGNGFDVKTLRKVVKLHRQDRIEREEEAALLDLYLHALDMTPSEQASAPAADADAPSQAAGS